MDDLPTPAQQNGAEPTRDDLAAEFPGWEIWRGVSQLCYGRKLLTSPPVLVRGEDWAALRDEIRGYLRKQP